MSSQNICLRCGACCAYFRVSFYWREADPSSGSKIPPALVEMENEIFDNMKGTNCSRPYCAALSGKIGTEVHCAIYTDRPSPCREFGIHYQGGKIQVDPDDLRRCNQARARWNLPPLTFESLKRLQNHEGLNRFRVPDHGKKGSLWKHSPITWKSTENSWRKARSRKPIKA